MSPFDSMTTKRPLADMSPANELRVEFVTWATNGSGVKFGVLCADDESAPATSMHAAAANRKASISLTIKTPKKQPTCSPGIEPT
jgi:hypothetical protein